MPEEHKGPVLIRLERKGKDFFAMDEFTVYEHHQWRIASMPEHFDILGRSDHGLEIIKHRNLPIFGLQFHPEKVIEHGKGGQIFEKIRRFIAQ